MCLQIIKIIEMKKIILLLILSFFYSLSYSQTFVTPPLDQGVMINGAKTFNLNISEFALLEQLKTKWHFSDYSETVLYCIWLASVSDGIETV